MPDEPPRQFEIDLPPELIGGAYADFANVWHTPTVFVMDFLTLAQPPREAGGCRDRRAAHGRARAGRRPHPDPAGAGVRAREGADPAARVLGAGDRSPHARRSAPARLRVLRRNRRRGRSVNPRGPISAVDVALTERLPGAGWCSFGEGRVPPLFFVWRPPPLRAVSAPHLLPLSRGREVRHDRDRAGRSPPASSDRDGGRSPRRRGIVFWIVRYLPAEIVGTAAMVLAGITVTIWTDNPPVVALAALLGEIVGFYAVLAVTIYAEQVQVSPRWRTAIARTGLLLIAEFGVAEVLDTLLIRPAALMLGVWLLPDPVWGLLAGKIVADIVFYAIAAGAFTLTVKAGLRDGARNEERARMIDASRTRRRPLDAIAARPPSRRDLRAARDRCRPRGHRRPRHARAAARPRAGAAAVPAPAQRAAVRPVPLRGQGALARRRHRAARRGGLRLRRRHRRRARPASASRRRAPGASSTRTRSRSPPRSPRRSRPACAPSSSTTRSSSRSSRTLPRDVRILVRLAYRSPHAKSDLSSKFGVGPFEAAHLVERAKRLGIRIAGFSFHVGSQLDDPQRFADAATRDARAHGRSREAVPRAVRHARHRRRIPRRRTTRRSRPSRRSPRALRPVLEPHAAAPRHHRRARTHPRRRGDDARHERRRHRRARRRPLVLPRRRPVRLVLERDDRGRAPARVRRARAARERDGCRQPPVGDARRPDVRLVRRDRARGDASRSRRRRPAREPGDGRVHDGDRDALQRTPVHARSRWSGTACRPARSPPSRSAAVRQTVP